MYITISRLLRNLKPTIQYLTIVFVLFSASSSLQTQPKEDSRQWEVYLFTIAPSDREIYSLWGHTALGMRNSSQQIAAVFDFGNFIFDKFLVYKIMSGYPQFYMGVNSLSDFLQTYIQKNRVIYRQRLYISNTQAQILFKRLANIASSEESFYNYNHFIENCTTRIRDIIDNELNGKLKSRWQINTHLRFTSMRDAALHYMRVQPIAWYYGQLFFHRYTYVSMNDWQRAFLPMYLMEQINQAQIDDPSLPIGNIEQLPISQPPLLTQTAYWQWFVLIGSFLWLVLAMLRGWFTVLTTSVKQKSLVFNRIENLCYSCLITFHKLLSRYYQNKLNRRLKTLLPTGLAYFLWMMIATIFSIFMIIFLAGHYAFDISRANYFWLSYSPINLFIVFVHIFIIRKLYFLHHLTIQQKFRTISVAHILAALFALLSLFLDIPIQQSAYLHALPEMILHTIAAGFYFTRYTAND